jgi:poly(hydroxyalkanoate) granule-associated protein
MVTKAQKKAVELKLVPRIESGMKEMEKGMENLVEQMAEIVSRSLYFGLGAAILMKEGFEDFIEKAVEKGETSEKDVMKRIRSLLKVEPKVKKVETTLETRIDTTIRKMLDSLDVPSKSDVEKLSKRVAELSGRVSKLTQATKVGRPMQA